MTKKYELTDETHGLPGGTIVHRIQALKTFSVKAQHIEYEVTEGSLGGYIQDPSNLDQAGTAWVDNDAVVCGNACVTGDSLVSRNAFVRGASPPRTGNTSSDQYDVWITGSSYVSGWARVTGHVRVVRSRVHELCTVEGTEEDLPILIEDSAVSGAARIIGAPQLSYMVHVSDRAEVRDYVYLESTANNDWLHVGGISELSGNLVLSCSGSVKNLQADQCVVLNVGGYNVIVTDKLIQLGCKTMLLATWRKLVANYEGLNKFPDDLLDEGTPVDRFLWDNRHNLLKLVGAIQRQLNKTEWVSPFVEN